MHKKLTVLKFNKVNDVKSDGPHLTENIIHIILRYYISFRFYLDIDHIGRMRFK